MPLPLPSLSTVAAIASATIPLLPPPLPLRRLPVTKQGLLRRHRHRSATIIAAVCCRRRCCCRHLPTVAAAASLPSPSPLPLLRRPVTKQVPLQRHGHRGAAFVAAFCCHRRRRCRHRPTVASAALLSPPLTLPLCRRLVTKQGPLHRHRYHSSAIVAADFFHRCPSSEAYAASVAEREPAPPLSQLPNPARPPSPGTGFRSEVGLVKSAVAESPLGRPTRLCGFRPLQGACRAGFSPFFYRVHSLGFRPSLVIVDCWF